MASGLKAGIPSATDYRAVTASPDFAAMEAYSSRFLTVHAPKLVQYAARWVADPLHQWSRQWEYPFVLSRLQARATRGHLGAVLDAGSGVTFFPFFVRSRFDGASVTCCDSDAGLAAVYRQIGREDGSAVAFAAADLRSMPFGDSQLDAVYCISVLEHTDRYAEILGEFHRILKPGGMLVLTFDVSMDGRRDATIEAAEDLLEIVTSVFDVAGATGGALRPRLADPDIFSTLTAAEINLALLPWRRPTPWQRLRHVIRGRPFGPWPPQMTVYCLDVTKGAR